MSWFGQPLSGAENWSLYPALQTVAMNNNILGSATEVQATNVAISDVAPEIEFDSGADKTELYRIGGDSTLRVTDDILLNNGGYILDTRLNPPTFNVNGSNLELRAKDPAGANYVMSSIGFPAIKGGAWYRTSNLTVSTVGAPSFVSIGWTNSAYGDTTTISQNAPNGNSFTVNQAGVYALMFQLQYANLGSATFTDRTLRAVINVNRGGNNNTVLTTSYDFPDNVPTNPTQQCIGQFKLEVGDIIVLQVSQYLSTGSYTLQGQSAAPNTFDLNTFWSWSLLSADGIAPYVSPAPIIQAAGTNALTSNNANTTFILTSGTTQNFTTAGLGLTHAGLVWYVKNGQQSGGGGNDVTIQENGIAIAGVTSVLHRPANSSNSASQTLQWNGTTLTMY